MASQLPGISGMRRETGGESEGETGCRGAREIQSKCPVQMIVGKTKCSTACICSSNDVPVVMVGLMLAPGMSLWRTTYITFSPPLMQLVLWPKQARARPSGNTSSGGPSAACPAPPGGAGSRSAGGPPPPLQGSSRWPAGSSTCSTLQPALSLSNGWACTAVLGRVAGHMPSTEYQHHTYLAC